MIYEILFPYDKTCCLMKVVGLVCWRRGKGVGMNKKEMGKEAENLAAEYLQKKGVHLIARNFRNRQGEVDLIGYDQGYLVFFEVKFRTSYAKGLPEESVGTWKQRQICKVADYYRCVKRIPLNTPIRYDVVAIHQGNVRWYRNAFAHIY